MITQLTVKRGKPIMLATLQDILDTVKADNLTYQQKLMTLGNIAERLIDPGIYWVTAKKSGRISKIR